MTPPRVLVAEDEPAMLSLVARHLRNMGFSVIEASEGDIAWDLAREQVPDLVILDVMMPGMSGWEICKRLKSDTSDGRPFARTGVIMLTGIGENLNEMTSPLFAADAWLNKPFDFSELDARVRETLERYEKELPATDDGKGYAGFATEAQNAEAESAPRAKTGASTARATSAKKPGSARKPAKKAVAKPPSKKKAGKASAPKRAAAPKKASASKKAGSKASAPKRAAAPKKAGSKASAPKRAAATKAPAKKRTTR